MGDKMIEVCDYAVLTSAESLDWAKELKLVTLVRLESIHDC